MPLLIPLSLHGKNFEPLDKLKSAFQGNLQKNKFSKEEFKKILKALPEIARQNMGSNFQLLQGVVA
ncbi:MAG: hypothetical protein AAGD28_28830 [Bacteroidota bacterium]